MVLLFSPILDLRPQNVVRVGRGRATRRPVGTLVLLLWVAVFD